MNSIPTLELQAPAGLARERTPRAARLARWISTVISPPVMAGAGLAIVAAEVNTSAAWRWAALEFGLALAAALAHIVWLVRRRQVTDYELPLRAQRLRPYLTLTAGTLAGWLALRAGPAPAPLTAFAGALFVEAVALLAITSFWKISLHTTAVTGVAALLWLYTGPVALPLIGLVPLVAWSRLRLRRHSLGQTVAGAVLGAGVVLALLSRGG